MLHQSRKPAKVDIVAFTKGELWVRAKIRSKVGKYGDYYNVDMEDGTEGGVYLRPPVNSEKQSWSLLPPTQWEPALSQTTRKGGRKSGVKPDLASAAQPRDSVGEDRLWL